MGCQLCLWDPLEIGDPTGIIEHCGSCNHFRAEEFPRAGRDWTGERDESLTCTFPGKVGGVLPRRDLLHELGSCPKERVPGTEPAQVELFPVIQDSVRIGAAA